MWYSAVGLLVTLTLSLLTAAPLTATAQRPGKLPHIGYLSTGATTNNLDEAFQQGLRDLGYVAGQNIVLEYRFAADHPERLPALAAELVQLPVDVLVTAGPGARAAQQATATIPIVFAVVADLLGEGLVASLARPVCRSRRPPVLWPQLPRPVPPGGDLCRQDPEGGQAGRPARGAAHDVRAGDQPQDRPSPGPDHSPVAPLPGG